MALTYAPKRSAHASKMPNQTASFTRFNLCVKIGAPFFQMRPCFVEAFFGPEQPRREIQLGMDSGIKALEQITLLAENLENASPNP